LVVNVAETVKNYRYEHKIDMTAITLNKLLCYEVIIISNVSLEQKLQLVQQVRSRYQENQYDMFNRERILYGKTSLPPEERRGMTYRDMYMEDAIPGEGAVSFLKMRFFLAAFLFAAVIFMDKNNINVAGITTEKIFQAISADYDEKIEEWLEAISYNVPQR
jgi:hypothetical protein